MAYTASDAAANAFAGTPHYSSTCSNSTAAWLLDDNWHTCFPYYFPYINMHEICIKDNVNLAEFIAPQICMLTNVDPNSTRS